MKKIDSIAGLAEKITADITDAIGKKIDALAMATAKGFAETATKAELRAVEKRLDNRLDAMQLSIERIEVNIHDHGRRLDRLEGSMRKIKLVR